jgi:hypothetical protein
MATFLVVCFYVVHYENRKSNSNIGETERLNFRNYSYCGIAITYLLGPAAGPGYSHGACIMAGGGGGHDAEEIPLQLSSQVPTQSLCGPLF